MSINLRCQKCHKTSKLSSTQCKCGNNLKGDAKRFIVKVRLPSGKWKTKTVETLSMAKKVEAKFKTEAVEESVFNIHKAPEIDFVWEHYLKWAKLNKKSWQNDESLWTKHIAYLLSGMRMDKITPRHIQELLSDMATKKTPKGTLYKPASVKHVYVLVRHVFNWSIRQEYFHGLNPCASIKPPKFDNKVTNPLDAEGIESLMRVMDSWKNERATLVIEFALYSGKRKSEILKLSWDNVDFQNQTITLIPSNTKSKKLQTLPLNNKSLEVLNRCHEIRISEYVFPCSTGKYFSGFSCIWERIRNRAGLSIRFHDLRHTYASYLASSGKVDIYTLKELLGHSSIEMTQRYAHLINGALRKAACVADEVFQNNPPPSEQSTQRREVRS